jgi:hypothetical protein
MNDGPANPAARSASPASSSKFGTFAITFSIVGPVIYCLSQYFQWPLFTYHPATSRLVWGYEAARRGEGPNMLWYGWITTTVLAAAAIGLIVMLLPERITRRIPLFLVWLLPILAIPYVVYSLQQWWFHP